MNSQTRLVLGTALAGSLLLTGCGAGQPAAPPATSAASGEETQQLTEIGIGVLPIVDVAPLYLGMKQGIFEKHGIKLVPQIAQGGAVIVPAVTSGQMQIGFSNVTSLAIARDKGLRVKIIAPASGSTGVDGADYTAVMAKKDSAVTDAKSLEGKRVAVNTMNNILDSTVSASMRKKGADPTKVKFVEVPFPDMAAQLEAGNVDAIVVSEPFVTVAEDEGNVQVLSNYALATEDLTVATYFATEEFIQNEPQTLAAFRAAVVESQEFATANPDKVRQILTEYTKMDKSVAERVTLATYPASVNKVAVADVAQMAETDGLIKDAEKVSDLVAE
ncbi:ABC transporter substrate-binding protein [Micrococcoides hystricis]|uniref:ABC transporter substrate-binding protein n=1 Tax=Micrococcoides hystricis TaxID=1572761 RepID=A0ABV6P8Y2_9MICC